MTDLWSWWTLNPEWLWLTLVLLSLAIGSFLNVVILRLPVILERQWRAECEALWASESSREGGSSWEDRDNDPNAAAPLPAPSRFDLLWPGSTCPHCGHRLTALENIPLLSYVFLRGRCAACSASISIQYPLVEVGTALLSVMVVLQLGPSWSAMAALVLTWGLIALAVIDLRTYLLPDALTIPLLWLGLLVNLSGGGFTDLASAVLGAVFGYLSLRVVFQVFKWITGKEGMGFGDFKLLALFGAWLGWQMLPLILLLASATGALVGVALIVLLGRDRHRPIPFGPFLAAAGWLALLYGDWLIALYWRWTGLA